MNFEQIIETIGIEPYYKDPTADYDIYRKSFPYYKVQYYCEVVMAWKDIQKRFTYPDDAISYMNGMKGLYRVMEVTRDGRHLYG